MSGALTSDGEDMPPLISPRGLRLNRNASIKCLDREVSCSKTLRLVTELSDMPFKFENTSSGVRKFLRLPSPQNSDQLTLSN